MKNSQKIEKIKASVLNNTLSNKIDIQLGSWLEYLEKELKFPLCELEIVKKQSKNSFIVDAFLEWREENYNFHLLM